MTIKRYLKNLSIVLMLGTALAVGQVSQSINPVLLAGSKAAETFGRESSIAGSKGLETFGRESSIAGSRADKILGRESS